ncbi:hypothetical protein GCM10009720_18120 [Yaniella flava]|uniref:Uncharacterized protein n=1 Tax=Yaniella flava TaxID=287930 RepID=A0ABN2UIV2_9MICC
MTKPLTSAQSAQQHNRTSDGKYTTKSHSESDVSLGIADDSNEQRRRLEIFTDGHDDQWHQDFMNNDIPTLREVAHYGWQTNDPYDLVALNDRFDAVDLHAFYDTDMDGYDAVHDDAGLTPELWMSDKDGQSWAKVSDQDLLVGYEEEYEGDSAYSAYAKPESFFDDDQDGRYQPELNKYDYFGGDYDFVHVIPPASVDSLVTEYDDPNSPLNCVHPPGETEVGMLPGLGPGEFEDGEIAVANAMHAKGVSTFVEYGADNPFEDTDGPNFDPHANTSIVHFYRTDDAGNERHFATGHTKGRLADSNIYGAQVMARNLSDINWVENSYERYDLDEWTEELGYEFEVADMSDPDYRRAAYEHKTITQQRQQLIDFFGDEDLVNQLAEEN